MDHGWPHRHAPATDGLCVWHLGCTDTGEIAIHQIGADLALQYRVAPVADVLQNQQSQHHLRRETQSAAPAALGMALHQCLVNSRDHRFIGQHCVDIRHPRFLQIFDLSRDESIPEAALRASRFNQAETYTTITVYRLSRLLLVFASHLAKSVVLLLLS